MSGIAAEPGDVVDVGGDFLVRTSSIMPSDKHLDPHHARTKAEQAAVMRAAMQAQRRASAASQKPERQGPIVATAVVVAVVVIGMLFVMLRFAH